MYDPLLLRTFLIVAEGHSFSATSEKLAVRQSTISDHIRRLERQVGRQLFVRDTHSVRLTPDGEALIGYAQSILDTGERARRYFEGSKPRRRLRFGASEDLVATILPDVLAAFTRTHPDVDLELTAALSTKLISAFDGGDLDLVFCKRWPYDERGELVWRDEIAWLGDPRADYAAFERGAEPWPLILYRPPSITRTVVIDALTKAKIGWRLSCTSDSLSGLVAATRSGLGVMVLARKLMPTELGELSPVSGLPRLGHIDFVLLSRARRAGAPVTDLVDAILATYGGEADDAVLTTNVAAIPSSARPSRSTRRR